jgi:mannose-1-phosphate guanylyltransferase/mannose-6-phosphate isomerase
MTVVSPVPSPATESRQQTEAATGLIVPVILSGGSGTRLWPVSRESYPKQFWPLVTERSLIEDTARRAIGPGFAPPIVVCNHEHRFMVAVQMRLAGAADVRIVLEPVGRNSAPAIAAAALLAAEQDPDAVLWMMAADAAISDPAALHRLLPAATAAARDGRIVLFGMQPTGPETGYGYIELGERLPGDLPVHALAGFVERPDAARAAAMAVSGRHLWNSGMFLFTAATLLDELATHAPAVLDAVRRAVDGRVQDLDFVRLGPAFAEAPSISLDYAVAERTRRAAVIPAELGWSDVGGWRALWTLGDKDERGNVAVGDVVMEQANDCYVRSDGILTAVVGLSDAVVVVTEDAVLAMHRDRAQDVKQVVDRLRGASRREAVAHARVYRPWGFHESLIRGDRFQVNRIVMQPGAHMRLQKHFHRAEHWVVVHGTARVIRDDGEVLVRENESIYLPIGTWHRLENPGRIPVTLIEVQAGSYLGDDDVERVGEVYSGSAVLHTPPP